MSQRLEGKVAIVTGAASGLGKATATLMVDEGAKVVLVDVNGEAGAALADELGPAACFAVLDVTDESQWPRVIELAVARFGALNILVNNAGISPHDTIEDVDIENWRHIHAVNLESVVFGCKHAVPVIAEHGGGSIVNLSSIAGMRGIADYASYGSSKAGIRNLTKSVAMHCAQRGYNIRCNSVHPGVHRHANPGCGQGEARRGGGDRHARESDPAEAARPPRGSCLRGGVSRIR